MLMQMGATYTAEDMDRLSPVGYDFKPADDGVGFVLIGWKGSTAEQLKAPPAQAWYSEPRAPALTLSQLIDRLIELREAGHGDCEVIYNDDSAHVAVTDLRVYHEYDGDGSPSVVMIE